MPLSENITYKNGFGDDKLTFVKLDAEEIEWTGKHGTIAVYDISALDERWAITVMSPSGVKKNFFLSRNPFGMLTRDGGCERLYSTQNGEFTVLVVQEPAEPSKDEFQYAYPSNGPMERFESLFDGLFKPSNDDSQSRRL